MVVAHVVVPQELVLERADDLIANAWVHKRAVAPKLDEVVVHYSSNAPEDPFDDVFLTPSKHVGSVLEAVGSQSVIFLIRCRRDDDSAD